MKTSASPRRLYVYTRIEGRDNPLLKRIVRQSVPFLLLASLILPLSLPALAKDGEDELDEKIERGMHNEAVRDYFRKQFIEFNTIVDPWGRRRTETPIPVEDQVDRMARVFLQKVVTELGSLESAYQQVQENRLDMALRSTYKRSRLKEWKLSLKNLSRTARDLRGTVKPILGLTYRKSMDRGTRHSFDLRNPGGIEKGLDALNSDTESVIKGVQGFFFESGLIVSVEDLSNNDLLVVLERVEKLANDLAQKI